ncbi:hypothetical protein [Amycolatopsis solani]|uniref:hypothetical protein n=1 Tax=Amycolatopsis solani TaxID=3028615 RepID=UPI0025B06317|nr:hypothetical protein [Amycolatopsis sp. MEP2-6]
MTEDFAGTPLPDLEAQLRAGGLEPARRAAIEAELNRRYAQKWQASEPEPGSPPAAATPPHFPGQVPGAAPPHPHGPPPGPWVLREPPRHPHPGPPAWGPPIPATPAKPAGLAKPLGCLAAFLVTVVAVVVFVVLSESESAPPPRIGTVCVTPRGSCPMQEALPVGTSCVCRSGFDEATGVVA